MFTTRVELHAADEYDYTALHTAMAKEGFSRTIRKEGESAFHLPTAEYSKNGEFTINQVLEDAKRAAATTRKAFGVLVTQSEIARAWYGLEPVKT
jgi:hypothetical protein